MKFLTDWELIHIHDRLIELYGGLPGMPDADRATAILTRVENQYFYEGVTDVFELAALYWVAISRGHIFNDANKRSSLAATLLFLARQNIQLFNDEGDQAWLVNLTVSAATGELTPGQLANGLRGSQLK